MKRSRYSDSQIRAILKQADSGVPVLSKTQGVADIRSSFVLKQAKYRTALALPTPVTSPGKNEPAD